ncbi:zinc finger ubi-d4 A isoform X1 [Brachionus plicatilis]|uniref:Zinc finger ubi-d4 A isoform X1 n=1 Tax=Brachionus plicatilis TaxID=10195 RepID=A0A3M7S743_BRAPC|nr:zinc finger ubi-d4 A isoform X1 [Brachionus plicatilis]
MDPIQETECKPDPQDDMVKVKGNEKVYREALLASFSFNQSLTKDRKARAPFFDSQTRITQTKDAFSVSRYQRKTFQDSEKNYIIEYPIRSWLKRKRYIIYPNDGYSFSSGIKNQNEENNFLLDNGISNSSLNQYLKQETDNEDSQIATISNIFHDDHLDFEENDDSDDNDYEESRKKKKKGSKSRKKGDTINLADEKPFVCDRCGIKYKTKPGLTYHIQKAHLNSTQSSLTPNNSGIFNQNSVKSDSINQDENTNSMLGFDDTSNGITNPPGNQQYQYNY